LFGRILAFDSTDLERFRHDVAEVARRRDLSTATEYGVRLNRLISGFDRRVADLDRRQRALLELAHVHVRAMMNCPRRMRLDNAWPDDFVDEATKTADALISLARAE